MLNPGEGVQVLTTLLSHLFYKFENFRDRKLIEKVTEPIICLV